MEGGARRCMVLMNVCCATLMEGWENYSVEDLIYLTDVLLGCLSAPPPPPRPSEVFLILVIILNRQSEQKAKCPVWPFQSPFLPEYLINHSTCIEHTFYQYNLAQSAVVLHSEALRLSTFLSELSLVE